jgi:thymidylate synthase (FAD)
MTKKYNYYEPKAWLVVQPAPADELKEHFNDALELIAYCARVSNPANQFNNDTGEKLVRYLIKHKHWSPLEMASATIGFDTTRDISHQVVRHRSFKFQEFSQRYADPAALDDAFVLREARLQDTKNRQNSIETDDVDLQLWWDAQQKFVIEHAHRIYTEALERGMAKEQARVILPEGLTKTRVFMAGDIRSWIHYIELRSGNGTQKEHMELARVIAQAIAQLFPMAQEFVSDG